MKQKIEGQLGQLPPEVKCETNWMNEQRKKSVNEDIILKLKIKKTLIGNNMSGTSQRIKDQEEEKLKRNLEAGGGKNISEMIKNCSKDQEGGDWVVISCKK